jgi:N-acetylneuraminate synthase/N,N'-diacetyllegionaminate synthase
VLACEKDVRSVSRQSLVVRRTLQAGDVIRAADITAQRPGTGVPASMWESTIGKRVAEQITAGTILLPEMLAEAKERAA